MGRSPCCSKEGLKKGAWTALEDKLLTDYVQAHGEGRWRNLPKKAGLKRCGKSCRLRWLNYLRPDIKRGNISADEEELIIRLHKLLGNRWSLIAGRLPGRTDNEIKNYWNTILCKKMQKDHQQNPIHSHRNLNNNEADDEVSPKEVTPTPKVASTQQDENEHCITNIETPPSAMNQETSMESGGYNDNGLSLFAARGSNDPTGLMFEFDMEELFMSDVLNTELSYEFTHYNSSSSSISGNLLQSTNAMPAALFSDEMLQDFVANEEGSDLNPSPFASFLDFGDVWLA